MLAIKHETRLKPAKDILLRAEEKLDRYYAFNSRSGDHYKLNSSAYWTLQRTCGGAAFQELLPAFRERFQLDRGTARKDLIDLLTDALNAGIIEEDLP